MPMAAPAGMHDRKICQVTCLELAMLHLNQHKGDAWELVPRLHACLGQASGLALHVPSLGWHRLLTNVHMRPD